MLVSYENSILQFRFILLVIELKDDLDLVISMMPEGGLQLQYAAPRWKTDPEITIEEIGYTEIHSESLNDDAKGNTSERKAQSEYPMNLSVTSNDDSPEGIDSWSIKSSGRLHGSRQIDVYQTNSTFFSDKDLKDLGPLVVRNRMSWLDYPFGLVDERTVCVAVLYQARTSEGKLCHCCIINKLKGLSIPACD